MNRLGEFYCVGPEPNGGEAYKWFARGAKHGDASAENNLGLLTLHGFGCSKVKSETESKITIIFSLKLSDPVIALESNKLCKQSQINSEAVVKKNSKAVQPILYL